MTEVNAALGCIILLDVPPGSAITLDGITRLTPSSAAASSTPSSGASTPYHRGLWIISNVSYSMSREDFHLLVVRSGVSRDPNNNGGGCRAFPVGFVLAPPEIATPAVIAADSGYDWIFARRYDPHTEEISDEPVDELTLKNLLMGMEVGGELNKFVITYDQFMGSPSNNKRSLPSWETRTSLINSRFLQRCHGISHGNKIIPSSDNSLTKHDHVAPNGSNLKTDGTSISYPPIPCIDRTINARQLMQHSATRLYLSKLSPEKRTRLLLGEDSGTEYLNLGEYVLKDVLCQYYGDDNQDDNDGSSSSKNDFLADVELSFLLFLFMECHSSLEHWRDAVSMCALSTTGATTNIVSQHPRFFQKLLSILYSQLSCIEAEFFEDVEYSSGDKNFMVGALQRLCNACESMGKRKRDNDTIAESLKSMSYTLRELVRDRFCIDLSLQKSNNDDDDGDMDLDTLEQTIDDDDDGRDSHQTNGSSDGPVIIPCGEVEASLARSSLQSSKASKWPLGTTDKRQSHHKEQYPLLYASMTDVEDEVMACARILDEAVDVSLVREAAAYLEEVEARRGGS